MRYFIRKCVFLAQGSNQKNKLLLNTGDNTNFHSLVLLNLQQAWGHFCLLLSARSCMLDTVYLNWGKYSSGQGCKFTLGSFVAWLLECWFQKWAVFGHFFSMLSSSFKAHLLSKNLWSSLPSAPVQSNGLEKASKPISNQIFRTKVGCTWQWGLSSNNNNNKNPRCPYCGAWHKPQVLWG